MRDTRKIDKEFCTIKGRKIFRYQRHCAFLMFLLTISALFLENSFILEDIVAFFFACLFLLVAVFPPYSVKSIRLVKNGLIVKAFGGKEFSVQFNCIDRAKMRRYGFILHCKSSKRMSFVGLNQTDVKIVEEFLGNSGVDIL